MDFVPGNSPSRDQNDPLRKIFSSWLRTGERSAIRDLESWRRLLDSAKPGTLADFAASLGSVSVVPTLTHGDFAPWNVKVSESGWTVLDWERGDAAGIPGWDWLHYIIQPAILVEREIAHLTLARLEKLFASDVFNIYAQESGIATHEQALTLAYLHYCELVTKQTEGLERIRALMKLIEDKWTGGLRVV